MPTSLTVQETPSQTPSQTHVQTQVQTHAPMKVSKKTNIAAPMTRARAELEHGFHGSPSMRETGSSSKEESKRLISKSRIDL